MWIWHQEKPSEIDCSPDMDLKFAIRSGQRGNINKAAGWQCPFFPLPRLEKLYQARKLLSRDAIVNSKHLDHLQSGSKGDKHPKIYKSLHMRCTPLIHKKRSPASSKSSKNVYLADQSSWQAGRHLGHCNPWRKHLLLVKYGFKSCNSMIDICFI